MYIYMIFDMPPPDPDGCGITSDVMSDVCLMSLLLKALEKASCDTWCKDGMIDSYIEL